jgi:hypothetical protein
MKNDQYFPHDVTAHDNIKLLRLKADKGLEGYGVYWSLLEYLRMQKNYSMPLSLLPALVREFRLSTEYLSDIILKYDLFVLDDEQYFSSPGLSKRMKPLDEKRKTMAAKKAQASEVTPLDKLPKRTQRRKKTVPMVDWHQEYAQEVNTSIVGTIIPIIVDSPAKESEITCSEVMQNGANELFESAQNNAQNSVQNAMQKSAKTTQNAHLQNADNERVAMYSLEEESKVEKDKGKYGCYGTTTARMDACTTTTSIDVRRRVRSERSPVLPKSLWEVYVSEAMGERSWLELQAMHSGMGMRFMECVPIIEETFKRHVRTYGTESKIHSLCDAKSYFSNFIKRGSPTRRIVEEALKTCTTTVDVYRYETLVNGRRTYCGVDIPAEAPPRPNGTAVWDGGLRIWSK